MGVYTEYLDRQFDLRGLNEERQHQLKRISEIRGRDVLVFAADLTKAGAPTSINYGDLLPITDQLAYLKGTALDLILETPGGSGEVAEDIIRLIRERYDDVAAIVPGYAKSAGTIMVMAADEILMGPASALGPIDAQLSRQGKVFSADALIKGMDKIKNEVLQTGVLNKAYIPILQGISPGELEGAENALKFAKILVTDWLAKYKFKRWTHHASTGNEVTDDERRVRAEEIAQQLCDHGAWLTHGRSIKASDLERLRVRVTRFDANAELADAITRYHTLLRMLFDTNVYKVFETPASAVYRFVTQSAPAPAPIDPKLADDVVINVDCTKCSLRSSVQVNLDVARPLTPGRCEFPSDNILRCPGCGTENNLGDLRRQIELQTKKRVIA